MDVAARLFRRFARARGLASVPATGAGSPPGPQTSAKIAQRERPQRPAEAAGADDAELDTLRGELVRELNRLAERSRGVD